jgi:hypothetical protein
MLTLSSAQMDLLTEVHEVVERNSVDQRIDPGYPDYVRSGVLASLKEETCTQNGMSEKGAEATGRPITFVPRVLVEPTRRGFKIGSVDQFPWAQPNTGARFPLPRIPINSDSLARKVLNNLKNPDGSPRLDAFPLQKLTIDTSDQGGLEITTGGAHGQFDYRRANAKDADRFDHPVSAGDGLIRLMGAGCNLHMNGEEASDLEGQLFKGGIVMVRTLLDRCLSAPHQWSKGMDRFCAQVVEKGSTRVDTRIQSSGKIIIEKGAHRGGSF